MSGIGDEFIVESFKVPWLIWIQLLVMILLIVLLFFGFSLFTLEPSSSSAALPSTGAAAPPPHLNNPSSSRRRAKAEVRRREDRATSADFIREEVQNGDESSPKNSSFSRNPNHPCDFFGLAKQAFLKCLGLDSSSEPSGSERHEKQECILSVILRTMLVQTFHTNTVISQSPNVKCVLLVSCVDNDPRCILTPS